MGASAPRQWPGAIPTLVGTEGLEPSSLNSDNPSPAARRAGKNSGRTLRVYQFRHVPFDWNVGQAMQLGAGFDPSPPLSGLTGNRTTSARHGGGRRDSNPQPPRLTDGNPRPSAPVEAKIGRGKVLYPLSYVPQDAVFSCRRGQVARLGNGVRCIHSTRPASGRP